MQSVLWSWLFYDMAEIQNVLMPVLAGLASWYGSHVALKTHLEYLRRDVDFGASAY